MFNCSRPHGSGTDPSLEIESRCAMITDVRLSENPNLAKATVPHEHGEVGFPHRKERGFGTSEKLIIRSDRRGAHTQFLVFILQLIKLPVNAALRQQFLVAADLPNVAFVHHDNLVRALNG
jgi:hypothetical protein